MINGTTIIDHKIRAELGLSLQEYTIMDYLQQCMEKGLHPYHSSIAMIALEFINVEPFIYDLEERGFIIGYIPTNKWTNAFLKPKKAVKKGFVAPSVQEVIEFFKSKGYNEIGAKKAFEYYSVADWTDRDGKPVKNWKQKMLANWLKDEYKQTNQPTGILMETKVYNR